MNENDELFFAVEHDDLEKVKNIIDKIDSINVKNEFGDTVLFYVKSPKVLKFLIEKGIDLDVTDDFGSTYLLHACERSEIEIIKILLEHDVNINYKNKDGYTALDRVRNADTEIIQLLLNKQKDLK